MPETHYRTCHLCEANCGLVVETEGRNVISIKGDKENPLSRGHICPKATAIADLQNDPDRLRTPMKRVQNEWQEISWQQAFQEIGDKFHALGDEPGQSAALYLGNPNVHNYGNTTQIPLLKKALRTRNIFSAASTDQLPQHLVALWMYGHVGLINVPDIDRAETLVILGGNPKASNGSVWTVPDFPKRVSDLQKRGGQLVVIDPRRTETAKIADKHLFIRPGGDVAFLLALLLALDEAGLTEPGSLKSHLIGWEEAWAAIRSFNFEQCALASGLTPSAIRSLAKRLANGPSAVYGRMGASTQIFGSTVHWLIQLVNISTGCLDREGGMMFALPATDTIGSGSTGSYDRYRSRVSGFPESLGEFPAVALSEEIETPGEGQVRALFTIAGNPVLSNPNGPRLAAALDTLELMVSIDLYINETTRHAHYILPPCGPLERDHYGLSLLTFAVRNYANYSKPLFQSEEGGKADWQIIRELSSTLAPHLTPGPEPRQMLDGLLKNGPYPLSLEDLEMAPHGIDLGALQSQLPQRLRTDDQKIHCAPETLMADLPRVKEYLTKQDGSDLHLIGRRHVRSNNSWLHNSTRLVKGKNRCTLLMHPDDAKRRNLGEGSHAHISSRTGSLKVTVEITEDMMPGVVSLPHGWGHNLPGSQLSIAEEHAGVSVNDLTDETMIDPISGNAAFNGVPVKVGAI